MQNINQMLTEDVFLEQTGKINAAFTELLIAKGGHMKPTSWAEVQRMVRDGTAAKVFSIGDQLTCQRGGVNLVWDVIGIDHDTPADPQFTHSLTLQLHDCFSTVIQFDAPEAFYYAENGLEARTYHFTMGSTDYQFTLDSDVAAGGQLILNFTGSTPTSLSVSATVGGNFVKDTNGIDNLTIAVTAGSGGTPLDTDYINNINRVIYGSNNYKESAIRQWLGSNAAAGSVWTPQTNFDRPPAWKNTAAGFMNGMDADFLAAIGKTHIVVARNTVTDGGGFDEMDDYFFLLSRSEVYGGAEVSGVNEGEPYPCYANYSDLSAPGTDPDSNRIKYGNGAARYWRLRTPNSEDGNKVRYVDLAGNLNVSNASIETRIVPACNII